MIRKTFYLGQPFGTPALHPIRFHVTTHVILFRIAFYGTVAWRLHTRIGYNIYKIWIILEEKITQECVLNRLYNKFNIVYKRCFLYGKVFDA